MRLVPVARLVQANDTQTIMPLGEQPQASAGARSAEGALRQLVPGVPGGDIFAIQGRLAAEQGAFVSGSSVVPRRDAPEGLFDLPRTSFRRIGSIAAPDPEPDFKRAAGDTRGAANHFGPRQEARETLRLLNRQQPQRIVHHGGDAAVLAAKAIQEHRVDQDAEEGFGLAAPCRHVQEADRVLIE